MILIFWIILGHAEAAHGEGWGLITIFFFFLNRD